MTTENNYVEEILEHLRKKDSLHFKKVKKTVFDLQSTYKEEFEHFSKLLYKYFEKNQIRAEQMTDDYLRMVNDMRREGVYFKKSGKYSCLSQQEAFEKVYSNKSIMNYYMNALLLSQILWPHHFKMLMYFNQQLNKDFVARAQSVLDIGPGHGFFSNMIVERLKNISKVDIVDISDESLAMTKAIIGTGEGRIKYLNKDIFMLETGDKYDLIIFGEVLEHLDHPDEVLRKLKNFLTPNGVLWLTTPTNAPAIDHIYLFRSKNDILKILSEAGLVVINEFGCYAENVSEEMAERFSVSYLYGAFVKGNG